MPRRQAFRPSCRAAPFPLSFRFRTSAHQSRRFDAWHPGGFMELEPEWITGHFTNGREAMVLLVRMHLDRRLWSKIDPEDIVQQTFQEALTNRLQFRGEERQRWPWLRRM